jgi:hypothetical protein
MLGEFFAVLTPGVVERPVCAATFFGDTACLSDTFGFDRSPQVCQLNIECVDLGLKITHARWVAVRAGRKALSRYMDLLVQVYGLGTQAGCRPLVFGLGRGEVLSVTKQALMPLGFVQALGY